MAHQCQTSSHTESISRWDETVYIDQIMSKADAQGLQNYIADGYVQRFYSCVFKLWGKIKILIVAFLQTYFNYITALLLSQFFNLTFRVVCCFGNSWSCNTMFLSSGWWCSCWWFLSDECSISSVETIVFLSCWKQTRTDAFSVLKALLRSYILEILYM